jgi:hypothetical protein
MRTTIPNNTSTPSSRHRNAAALAILVFALGSVGCASDPATPEGPTKDEVRAMGKADWPFDFCKVMGWFDDDECDEFCKEPDPDCPAAFQPCQGRDCRDACKDADGNAGFCTDHGECAATEPAVCYGDPGAKTTLSAKPLGTYERSPLIVSSGFPAGELAQVTFFADQRYHLKRASGSTTSGTYTLSGTGQNRKVTFNGSATTTYGFVLYDQIQYGQTHERIDLHKSGGDLFTLQYASNGWCASASDCGEQQGDSIPAYCAPGAWLCSSHQCQMRCDH